MSYVRSPFGELKEIFDSVEFFPESKAHIDRASWIILKQLPLLNMNELAVSFIRYRIREWSKVVRGETQPLPIDLNPLEIAARDAFKRCLATLLVIDWVIHYKAKEWERPNAIAELRNLLIESLPQIFESIAGNGGGNCIRYRILHPSETRELLSIIAMWNGKGMLNNVQLSSLRNRIDEAISADKSFDSRNKRANVRKVGTNFLSSANGLVRSAQHSCWMIQLLPISSSNSNDIYDSEMSKEDLPIEKRASYGPWTWAISELANLCRIRNSSMEPDLILESLLYSPDGYLFRDDTPGRFGRMPVRDGDNSSWGLHGWQLIEKNGSINSDVEKVENEVKRVSNHHEENFSTASFNEPSIDEISALLSDEDDKTISSYSTTFVQPAPPMKHREITSTVIKSEEKMIGKKMIPKENVQSKAKDIMEVDIKVVEEKVDPQEHIKKETEGEKIQIQLNNLNRERENQEKKEKQKHIDKEAALKLEEEEREMEARARKKEKRAFEEKLIEREKMDDQIKSNKVQLSNKGRVEKHHRSERHSSEYENDHFIRQKYVRRRSRSRSRGKRAKKHLKHRNERSRDYSYERSTDKNHKKKYYRQDRSSRKRSRKSRSYSRQHSIDGRHEYRNSPKETEHRKHEDPPTPL